MLQKVNFVNVTLAWISQILKYIYDYQAEVALREFSDASSFYSLDFIFMFNQVCMAIDSSIIIIASISLLKYTSMRIIKLKEIILTISKFISHTVRKTLTLIVLMYILFGQMSQYILSYYQYGFFFTGYSLLRSCITFLSGFVINEQKIFLSEESVENLINYNGFILTFCMLLGINILIRQVMINIVAIYMHDDYHKSKMEF